VDLTPVYGEIETLKNVATGNVDVQVFHFKHWHFGFPSNTQTRNDLSDRRATAGVSATQG
jgi:hypothetical protein